MDFEAILETLEQELERAGAPMAGRALFEKLSGRYPGLERKAFFDLLPRSPRLFVCWLDKLNLLVGLEAWGSDGYLQAVRKSWAGARRIKASAPPALNEGLWRAVYRVAREKGEAAIAALAAAQLPPASDHEPTTLREWSEWLEPRVAPIQLLGELDISTEAVEQLGDMLRNFVVRSQSPAEAIHELESQFPLPFAAFLVFYGIHKYESGTYWPPVCEALSLPTSNSSTQMGQAFERILTRYRLPSMDNLTGVRYVRRIVAHGGVPDHSLAAFFREVVAPSVTDPDLQHLSAGELLATAQHWMNLGQAIRWFVEAGGRFAEDIIERCRDLTRESLRLGEVSSEDTGLPSRFLEGLRALFQTEALGASVRQDVIPRPYLALEPWAEGLRVDFPAGSLRRDGEQATVVWQVSWGREALTQTQVVRIRQGCLELPSQSFRLPDPAREYRCTVQFDGHTVQTVNLVGVDRERPVLLFSPRTGRALGQRVPDCQAWLVYPRGPLTVDGAPPKLIEEFPGQRGGWYHYQSCWVDLAGARAIELRDLRYRLELAPEVALNLEGEVAIDEYGAEAGIPVYRGALPVLSFSLPSLDGWKLQIQTDVSPFSAAGPSLERFREGQSVRIPLDQLVRGHQPGEYRVLLRGQLGQDSRRTFRFVPGLDYKTSSTRESRGKLMLVVPASARVLQEGKSRVPVRTSDTEQVFLLQGDSGRPHLTATVEYPRAGLPDYRLPLQLPLPRPCWALSGLAQEVALYWSDARQDCPLDLLDEADTPELLLQLPESGEAQLVLLHDDGTLRQSTPPQLLVWKHGRARGRFPLKPFLDTLRASNRAATELCWRIGPEQVAALRVSRHWEARDLAATVTADGGLQLTWRQDFAAQDRHVRVWNLARPAHPPLKVALGDEIVTETTLALDLEPGAYQLELFLEDPWLAGSLPAPVRPNRSSPSNAAVHVAPERWEEVLASLPPTGTTCLETFLLHYERQGAGRHVHLYELRNRLSPDELDTFLRAVLHLTVDDRSGDPDVRVALDQYCAVALTDHVDHVLRVIPTLVADESPAFRQRFVYFLLALRLTIDPVARIFKDLRARPLGPLELDKVWSLWEPLGVIAELQAPGWGAADRLARHLGQGWRAMAGNWGLPHWGQAPGSEEVRMEADQLRATWHFLGIAPDAPMTPEYLQKACFLTWKGLWEREQRAEAGRWAASEWPRLEQALRTLPPEMEPALRARLPGKHECAREPLRALPFVVGCVACFQRLAAHDHWTLSYLKNDLVEQTRRCFEYAPELFARDLCQVELAVAEFRLEEEEAE